MAFSTAMSDELLIFIHGLRVSEALLIIYFIDLYNDDIAFSDEVCQMNRYLYFIDEVCQMNY